MMGINHYKSDVTIEPIFGDRLEEFKTMAKTYGFDIVGSIHAEGYSEEYDELRIRLVKFMKATATKGIEIDRYSIIKEVLNSHMDDSEFPLGWKKQADGTL